MAWIKITWTRSTIGLKRDQGLVIEALGLRHMHQTVVHMDSPSIRGMVFKVKHLVDIEEVTEVEAEALKSPNQKAAAAKGAH